METLATTLKALGHIDRLRIVALLSKGELTVTELVQILELSQPRVTQYIKSLEGANIVERLREGSWVFSRLKRNAEDVKPIIDAVIESLPEQDTLFMSDMRRLKTVREDRSRIADIFFASVANNQGQLSDEYLPQEKIERALRKAIEGVKFDRMIDLGTGTGRMLELFSDNIRAGTGIDSNPDMLKVARHKLAEDCFQHISVQQGDLNQTPFKDQSADLITLHQVLHYLDDPGEAIKEAARLLSDDGMLLIIDYETHGEDRYRDEFAHRRLGFSQDDMDIWGGTVSLKIKPHDRISNNNSPAVIIWKAQRL